MGCCGVAGLLHVPGHARGRAFASSGGVSRCASGVIATAAGTTIRAGDCHNYSVRIERYASYVNWRRMASLTAVVAGLAGCLLGVSPAHAAALGHAGHRRGRHEYRPLDWTLRIPAIGVSAPVIRLGGSRSGAIAVPTFAQVWDVGWYRYGAVPGAQGNAVLLAHVDTYAGPAVFYNLYRLLPGERVEVDLGAHDIQRFTVRWVKEVLKTDFPAAKVFGRTRGTHLWLVTCGGAFDYQTRSYLSNIIVYTTGVTPRKRRSHRHHREVPSARAARLASGTPAAGSLPAAWRLPAAGSVPAAGSLPPPRSPPASPGGNSAAGNTTGGDNAATLGRDQSGT